jgi:hypothetical protein
MQINGIWSVHNVAEMMMQSIHSHGAVTVKIEVIISADADSLVHRLERCFPLAKWRAIQHFYYIGSYYYLWSMWYPMNFPYHRYIIYQVRARDSTSSKGEDLGFGSNVLRGKLLVIEI